MKKKILIFTVLATFICLSNAQETGSYEDKRDGAIYQTIKIGNQVWMAQNLNFKADSLSWCYDNDSNNCIKYGRLYTFGIAKEVCPSGWHLPSKAEYEILLNYFGDEEKQAFEALKEGGISGFNVLYSGMRLKKNGFGFMHTNGRFWSSTEYSDLYAWYMDINSGKKAYMGNYSQSWGYSVRCLQD